jgi:SnoaL-like domain
VTPGDVLTRMLHAIDELDWDTMRDCFAAQVRTDYTSLWGGEPATVPIGDLISDWQGFAHGLAATQHQTGPVRVAEDGTAHTHVTAHHWLPGAEGGDRWTVYAHYVFGVEDDRIADLTLRLHYQDGNGDLPVIARERATTDPPRGPVPD